MKTKKLFLSIFALLLLILSTFFIISKVDADSEVVLTGVELKENYNYGEIIYFDKAKISVDGIEASPRVYVTYPNGEESESPVLKLNQEGLYELNLKATISGSEYTLNKSFKVSKPLYGVLDKLSKVEYGTYSGSEHGGANYYGDDIGSVTGLMVSLRKNDVFTYNLPIDITNYTSTDRIIEFATTPSIVGQQDASLINVYLTDCYDPTNVVQISIKASVDGVIYSNSYMKVAAPGQVLSGHEWNFLTYHVGDSFGYPFRHSFSGDFNYKNIVGQVKDNVVVVAMDYKNKAVHMPIHGASLNTLVADLDDPNDFATPWKGFTTGECFVSIEVETYISSSYNFVITKLGDQDLTKTDYESPRKVEPKVDFDGYEASNLPKAYVNYPYKVFESNAINPFFSGLLTTYKVYYDYENAKEEVTSKDGYFTPSKAGIYTIEYKVVDPYKQEFIKLVEIECISEPTDITYNISDDFYPNSAVAGQDIKFLNPNCSSPNSRLEISLYIEANGVKEKINDNHYFFTKGGNYKLIVEALDYAGYKKGYSKDITVENGTKPTFVGKPSLPKYFISGYQYVLPEVFAYNYTDGSGAAIETTLSYKDSTGSKKALKNKVTPVVNNNGETVTITYTATLNGVKETLSFEIPVIINKDNDDNYILSNYVYGIENSIINKEAFEYNVDYSFMDSTALMDYVIPQNINGLNISFSGVQGFINYSKVSIILTDTINENQQVKLTYSVGSQMSFFLNDNVSSKQQVGINYVGGDYISLNYNSYTNKIEFDRTTGATLSFDKYLDGNTFNGFDSGKVYITFMFEGNNKLSKLSLITISNQYICSDGIEFVGPSVSTIGENAGILEIGTEVALMNCSISDAIDPNPKATLSVKFGDNEDVYSTDGVLLRDADVNLGYRIICEKAGAYTVIYKVVDESGNETSLTYVLNILDEQKPVQTINGSVPTQGKVNEKLIFPTFTATDDTDPNPTLEIFIITSRGNIYMLPDRGFAPKQAGTYTVRYYTQDESGNLIIQDFKINVTE